MPLIALKCPECGGDIQLDDAREFGFCMYCGCKVLLDRAAPAGRPPSLRNILVLAYECIASEDWASAKPKVEQALMIDIDCPDAWFMKALVCKAEGNFEGERRAVARGRSLEEGSLGVMSFDDYDRIVGRRVTFLLSNGFTRSDSKAHLEIDGKPYVLCGRLEVKLDPGEHDVLAYDMDAYGDVHARTKAHINPERECSYVVRCDIHGISIKRARPRAVPSEAAQPPSPRAPKARGSPVTRRPWPPGAEGARAATVLNFWNSGSPLGTPA